MNKSPLPPMSLFPLLLFTILAIPHFTNQLDLSQYNAILRIKQQLNFPQDLTTTWAENQDFCNSQEPSQTLTLVCYEENITQLHITGNNEWFPNLGQDFSVASLFTNLADFPNLKVLSLASLGLKGNLPLQIGDLSALEILNLTSNGLNGTIPREVLLLKNLQTLILDHNMFSGNVPDWIGDFAELTVLSLKNNSFSGVLPYGISCLVNLRRLVLSENNFTGEVPGFHNLTNLQVLDLGKNNLGPKFPNLPRKLVSLVLTGNKFHSTLSDELNSCYLLQRLDISSNEIVGQFPPSILDLNALSYLDIGGNKLTGKMLKNMSCTAPFTFANLTGNRLTGDLPGCLDSTKDRIVLYGGNCLSESYKFQKPLPFCHNEALAVGISPHKEHGKKNNRGSYVVASSVVGGVAAATLLAGLAFVFRKREFVMKSRHLDKGSPGTRLIVDKVSPAYTLQLLKDARYISETTKLGALGIPPYRTFVLDELKEATGNFSVSNLIGEGSRGQVYKGILTDGTIVAIRSLKVKKRHGIHNYTPQLELIAKLRHCHLVSALGHCFECNQDDSIVAKIFLVFEYVSNGTLRTFVSDGQPAGKKLTWTQRLAAGIGVARGVQFLHTGIVPGVYSNSMKITDVLIDHDFHVKIGKYNLPLLTEGRRMDETAAGHGQKDQSGTILSCPEKNDIYDFGVILLEIIVGRTITCDNDINISKDILSVSLTADAVGRRSIVDPAVHKECSDNSLKTLIELCVRCLSNVPSERPSIEDVLWNLQFAAQVQDTSTWDGHPDSPAHVSRMEPVVL